MYSKSFEAEMINIISSIMRRYLVSGEYPKTEEK